MTLPQLIDARAEGEYRLWLSYDDGRQGEVDLADELSGELFEPLRDHEFFKRFTLNPNLLDAYPHLTREGIRAALA
jgi:hypothetical protein